MGLRSNWEWVYIWRIKLRFPKTLNWLEIRFMRRLNDKKSLLPEHPELEEHSLISKLLSMKFPYEQYCNLRLFPEETSKASSSTRSIFLWQSKEWSIWSSALREIQGHMYCIMLMSMWVLEAYCYLINLWTKQLDF